MNEKLKFFTQTENRMPLFISLAGITYPDSNYCITRKISGVNVIEYVLDGEGAVWVNGREHRVTKDTVYLLYKGEPHRYYSDANNPFTKIFLNITGDFYEKIVSSYEISGKHFFDGGTLRLKFERILKIIDDDMPDNEKQAALQGLLLEIMVLLKGSVSNAKHSEEAAILKEYIEGNIKSIVSTEKLAQIIFRSKDYCLKLFKKEFGMTPYSYQIENKMKTAKNLLANTAMTVGEISEALGYSDAHYFSNLFLNKCGMRPIAYRKSKK